MLGALIYITLDVSFNIIYWTSQKTISGISIMYYYITERPLYYEQNAILPPSYENTIDMINKENKESEELEKKQKQKENKENIKALLEQIEIQKNLLNKLEFNIINYNEI